MKYIFIFTLALLCNVSQADTDTPESQANRTKYEAMSNAAQQEAEKMSTLEVYNELERLDLARNSRYALHPESYFSGSDNEHRDFQRSIGFSTVLSSRRDKGEVSATFYFGIRNWKYCQVLQEIDKGQLGYKTADCWKESLDSFKVASAAKIPAATFNIARMYESGFGVITSKYVAANWYVKSADQYNKANLRDEALTSLEAALAMVPDHPAALRLRKVLLK